MAPDGGSPTPWAEPAVSGRGDRLPLLTFTLDMETELAVRRGLLDRLAGTPECRRGGLDAAITALKRLPTPCHLIVDISGHPEPLAGLEHLAQVLEPDVKVLLVGDREDMDLYRKLTRDLGALDYLAKPLTPAKVAEHFGPHFISRTAAPTFLHGGRIIAMVGARGGVGTSTIAANLAWFLASQASRHALLLDADLDTGTGALLLAATPGPGLTAALERPERMDNLLVERATTRVTDRLHLLAAEAGKALPAAYAPGAAERLLGLLERRYNYIVVDVPRDRSPFATEILKLAHQRVVVIEPGLAAVRDGLRLLHSVGGMMEVRRPLLTLNRAGRPGGLATKQLAEAMGQLPEVCFPDQPKLLGQAAMLGEMAAARPGPFRSVLARLARETAAMAEPMPVRRGLLGRLGLRR
jgi:pilus assembly protein CpaE